MSTPKSSDASSIAREAALQRHAFSDTREATLPARRGFMAKFEMEVDPEGVLDIDERHKRARRLLRAHMSKLARKSAASRRRKSEGET